MPRRRRAMRAEGPIVAAVVVALQRDGRRAEFYKQGRGSELPRPVTHFLSERWPDAERQLLRLRRCEARRGRRVASHAEQVLAGRKIAYVEHLPAFTLCGSGLEHGPLRGQEVPGETGVA